MDGRPDARPLPSLSKSCSRCRARKVKCDLGLPRCSACQRLSGECDIQDCIAYSHSTVQSLLDEIDTLRARLDSVSVSKNTAGTLTPFPDAQLPAALQQQPFQGPNQVADESFRKAAEEIGILAVGGPSRSSEGSYVGSASGSTFARIFFKQLGLLPAHLPELRGAGLEISPTFRHAALPPRPLARKILAYYIARVHTWWPILKLPDLRATFQKIYQTPQQCDDAQKFLVFIVLALGSRGVSESETISQSLHDMNEPSSYFQTSLHFLYNFYTYPRDLTGIQSILLVTIWILDSPVAKDVNDLWHLTRYLMSAAIEIGLHRHNTDWGFTAEELEARNRTMWAIYNLERNIGTTTGRPLSVRERALQTLMPTPMAFDALTEEEAIIAPIFAKQPVMVFQNMIKLRRLMGRTLNSVYVGRNAEGTATDLTLQEICSEADDIRLELAMWDRELSTSGLKPSREYSEMKIESCLAQLLLHRPSPTFMVPSNQMLHSCSKAASSAVKNWRQIERCFGGIAAVCHSSRNVHAILIVGLAALYCDWRSSIAATQPQAAVPAALGQHWRHVDETRTCLDFLQRGIAHLKASHLSRFAGLFEAVMNMVYKDKAGTEVGSGAYQGATPSTNSQGAFDMGGPILGSAGEGIEQGLEIYLEQVGDFLGSGEFSEDQTLNEWYTSLMGELQG